jgi:hypothetical protein
MLRLAKERMLLLSGFMLSALFLVSGLDSQVATANTSPRTSAATTTVVVGDDHACALLPNRTVQCWGGNGSGQLGNGSGGGYSDTPTTVKGLSEVSSIAVGGSHSCASLLDGNVRCWGGNSGYQLGFGTTSYNDDYSFIPVAVAGASGGLLALGFSFSCASGNPGIPVCWGSSSRGFDFGGNGRSVPYGITGATEQLVAGESFACALSTSGQVSCFGDNRYRQLGSDSGGSFVKANILDGNVAVGISAKHKVGCAVVLDKTVNCWGQSPTLSGYWGGGGAKLPQPLAGLDQVEELSIGEAMACVIKTNRTLWCWGSSPISEVLGEGNSLTARQVQGLAGVESVDVADSKICIVLSSSEVKCLEGNDPGASNVPLPTFQSVKFSPQPVGEQVLVAGSGRKLVAEPSIWSGAPTPKVSFKWMRCSGLTGRCKLIKGQTKKSYTTNSSDRRKWIEVTVTGTNASGKLNASTNRLFVSR